jgi:hypothetical protein
LQYMEQGDIWHSLYHLRFTCKWALFESRRADSNR